ncbi:MAG: GntR family transcriptional regulator [Lachnospira sp.]|nr:GntR family transcriptional regulator [Lachnospira sp.]
MKLAINSQSKLAIYEQIVEQIKNEIILHNIAQGDMLPSIRSLARELRISVITTKHAYEELLKEGLIYSKAGKGFYVAEQNRDLLREKKMQQIEAAMSEVIVAAKGTGLSKEETKDMLLLLWEEE